jgi:hypothetical protein
MASDCGVVSPEEFPTKAPGGEAGRLWDPLGAWPAGRRWLWAVLAVLACSLLGPEFIESLRPMRDRGVDFFQEWASARNFFSDLPIYMNQKDAIERHLGYHVDEDDVILKVNAHPPTSVLLALPLAGFDYPDAVLVWNLGSLGALVTSLWLVAHEMGIALSAWTLFPTVTLLLLCNPLRQQVNQGQLNLILLLLVTGVWVAERTARPRWAGALLGAATAIKLFPGFLFLYFAMRRQWRIVASGAISFAALTGLTAAVLGPETYRSYIVEVLPKLERFRDEWANASLVGLWTKLFNPQAVDIRLDWPHCSLVGSMARLFASQTGDSTRLIPGGMPIARTEPLWRNAVLAQVGAPLSCTAVVAVLARAIRRARSRTDHDRTFGLALTTMLLISPISWDHYFLILIIPLALVWAGLPTSGRARVLFLINLAALWVSPFQVWITFIQPQWVGQSVPTCVSTPTHTISVLSFQCYALLGLFAFIAAGVGRQGRSEESGQA